MAHTMEKAAQSERSERELIRDGRPVSMVSAALTTLRTFVLHSHHLKGEPVDQVSGGYHIRVRTFDLYPVKSQ
jgi:hypothetical protein